jgi:gamma-glutamyltranspeptidase/glutathione hydrolase
LPAVNSGLLFKLALCTMQRYSDLRTLVFSVALYVVCGLCWLVFQSPVWAQSSGSTAPEADSGWQDKPTWQFKHFAVVTAHPLASEAGAQMLREGGSAIDAAIASQMVLGLVEPQSSGIGGGGFLTYSNGKTVQVYDGRETAPQGVTEALFLEAAGENKGQPMAFHKAKVGGLAVGVPGLIAMLHLAHKDHGRLAWARLFEPAIALAEEGFPISQRLHALLKQDRFLRKDTQARAYFYDANLEPFPVGHLLRNPALAQVLRGLAQGGPGSLYSGELSNAVVAAVQGHATNPGLLRQDDFKNYNALRREPLCFNWQPKTPQPPQGAFEQTLARPALRVCGPPPPSSGPLAIGQILGILSQLSSGVKPVDRDYLFLEAARLAFADRAKFVADPGLSSSKLPDWQTLLEPSYLKSRAALISEKSLGKAPAGKPGGFAGQGLGAMPMQIEAGTTHLSIMDHNGHALALTSSIESAFGSRLMVNGFLLNNQLTDFSFKPFDDEGHPIANRVEPNKRPRSSMSPLLVFDPNTHQAQMALGSAGGALIIHYVTKALINTINEGLPAKAALEQPHLGSMNGPALLEAGRYAEDRADVLHKRGNELRFVPMTSGTHVLLREDGQLWGAADPRRDGWAVGE